MVKPISLAVAALTFCWSTFAVIAAAPRNPVSILPALPAADDTSFYANKDVPRGRVDVVHNEKFRMPIYFAAGETDIALFNSMRTLAVFNNHGIRNFWVLSSHGHEWLNWRRYLYQTAQIMFPEDR